MTTRIRQRLVRRRRQGSDEDPPPPAEMLPPLEFSADECKAQLQSPLFGAIPPEIRNEIFRYALTQYEDMRNSYSEEAYWYRPGYRAPRRIDTALLRTCRRVYLETRGVPAANYEHSIWGCDNDDRAPPSRTHRTSHLAKNHPAWFPSTLYPLGRFDSDLCLSNVRFFTQLCWLERGSLGLMATKPFFRTKKLSIVIRHTDCWHWEDNIDLYIKDEWLNQFRCPDSVEEVELEFETVERKKDQLDTIVARQIVGGSSSWKFIRKDGSVFTTSANALGVSRWVGTPRINGQIWSENVSLDRLCYYVVKVTWRLASEAAQESAESISSAAEVLAKLKLLGTEA